MNRVIEYFIKAKDQTAAAISSAKSRISSFTKSVAQNLMNIKAGFDMAFGAVNRIVSAFTQAIGEAFKFEKAVANFKTLLGSVDAAKTHLNDLRQFAAATPLTFPDLQEASKLLLSFGASVETIMPSLKMLGDISMGDRQKFQGLALVFAQVKAAGRLMGQDLLQMINQGFNPLTVIAKETGKSVGDLKKMMEEGAISFEMVEAAMRSATSQGGLFFGAMEEASKTGEGMISTMQDNWADAVRIFGEAFADAAKNGVSTLNDAIVKLKEDGTIEAWAKESVKWLEYAKDGIFGIGTALEALYKYSGAKDLWNYLQGTARGIGDAIGGVKGTLEGGGGFADALKAAGKGFMQGLGDELGEDGFYWQSLGNVPPPDAQGEKDKRDAKKDAKAAADAAKSSGEAAGVKTIKELFEAQANSEAWAKELADKQEEIDIERQRAAYELEQNTASEALAYKVQLLDEYYQAVAECRNKDELKELDKEKALFDKRITLLRDMEKEREDAEKKAADEAERLAEKRMAKELKAAKKLADERLDAAQKEEEAMQSRVEAAQDAVSQAWGWYKDKDSLKAKIASEEEDIAARAQYAKDYKSLTHGRWSDEFAEAKELQRLGHYDKLEERMAKWRKGAFGLDVETEATMRVALAQDEEKNASQRLSEIADHTAQLQTIVDILSAGGEE